MATGRTVSKFRRVYIDGYDMSHYGINIGPLAVTYPESLLAAFDDEVTGTFPGIPRISPGTLNGVLDNTPTSGLHALMNGAGVKRYVMVAQGMRAVPALGDPVFAGCFEQLAYNGTHSSVDDTYTVTIPFSGSDVTSVENIPLDDAWAKLLHANEAETTVNTDTGIDDGASSTRGGAFFWQILAADGTVTLKAQHNTANWSAVKTGLTALATYALAINPTTPAIIYAGIGTKVFKTTDSGANWTDSSTGLPSYDIHAIVIDPLTPTTLYAATYGGKVYKSTNSAGSWTVVGASLTGLGAWGLAIDPATPANLYVGTYGGGVWFSTDSGANWTQSTTNFAAMQIKAMAVNPTTPTIIYAGAWGDGVYKSTDSGVNFVAVNTGLTDHSVYALAINPTTPTTLYAGTNAGVFKSTDSGANWTAANTGLTPTAIQSLAINPSTPTTLYAGSTNGDIYRSTDSGGTWTAVSTGTTPYDVTAIAINPSTPTTLYAGLNGDGVYKSTAITAFTDITGATSGVQAAGVSAGMASIAAGTAINRYVRYQIVFGAGSTVTFVAALVRSKI